jgi:hypothetical protein
MQWGGGGLPECMVVFRALAQGHLGLVEGCVHHGKLHGVGYVLRLVHIA